MDEPFETGKICEVIQSIVLDSGCGIYLSALLWYILLYPASGRRDLFYVEMMKRGFKQLLKFYKQPA